MSEMIRTEITVFSNKFEVLINPICLTTIRSLNIGNLVKKALTREICNITGKYINNISSFKKNQDLINTKLNELNPRIEEYMGAKNKQVLFLVIQYIGIQEQRDKKIKELMK